ncbi:hypothetical protein N9N67_08790 [Bacteriovoracaceae bacterium]|nr:hypothetical protein [Bacteriovoracaceae bacterium]
MKLKNILLLIVLTLAISSCAGIKLLFYFAHSYMAKEVSQFMGLKGSDREKIEADLKNYKNKQLINIMSSLEKDARKLISISKQLEKSKDPQKYFDKFSLISDSIRDSLVTFQEDMIGLITPYVIKLNQKQQAKVMLNLEKSFDQKKVNAFPNERKFNKYKRNKIEARLKFFIGDMNKDQKHMLKKMGKDVIITKKDQLNWQNQFKTELAELFKTISRSKNKEEHLKQAKALLYNWAISRKHDPNIKKRREGTKKLFFQILLKLGPNQRNQFHQKLEKIANTLKSLTAG